MSNTQSPRNDAYQARLNGRPQWVYEHGSAFDVPDIIANDPELEDISWHHDAMPSFCLAGTTPGEGDDVRLWVDHPDQDQREFQDKEERFGVFAHGTETSLYEGDDAAEALRILKSTRKGQ